MSSLVDDAGRDQSLPAPTPVRHILARPGEAAFLGEVRQNLSPPDQSEFNRRVRWLGCAGTS